MTSINNSLFSILIKSTENNIGKIGTTSLSEALKSNTTLTELNLSCEHKRNNTQMISTKTNNSFIIIQSTENNIKEEGTAALSDVLKSNTTLIQLDLNREHKRNNTQMISISNSLFSFFTKSTDNWIGKRGATLLSDALKSNSTLTELNLRGEDKRTKTNCIHYKSTLHIINRKHHQRPRKSIVKKCIEIKHNTHKTRLGL